MNWYLVLGSFAYIFAGYAMNDIIANYIYDLAKEVEQVDARWVDRMYLKIPAGRKTLIIVKMLLFAIWPAIAIAAILKAEDTYDRVVKRNPFRNRAQ